MRIFFLSKPGLNFKCLAGRGGGGGDALLPIVFFFPLLFASSFLCSTFLVPPLSLSGTGFLRFATIDTWGHNTFTEKFFWKTDENSQDNSEEAKHSHVLEENRKSSIMKAVWCWSLNRQENQAMEVEIQQ